MNFLLNFFLLAAEEDPAGGGCDSTYLMFGVIGVFAVLLFVMPMITNRKKGKQINDMRTTLRLGDEIMTIGGIVGKVVEIIEKSPAEKDFVIETGSGDKKSTMIFDLRALHENRTRMKELAEEAARQAELARIERENKKAAKMGVPAEKSNVELKAEPAEEVFESKQDGNEPEQGGKKE